MTTQGTVVCIDCGNSSRGTRCPSCAKRKQNGATQAYYRTKSWRDLCRAFFARPENQRCANCGNTHRLTPHHIVARTKGGADALSNLLPLCGKCHGTYELYKRRGKDNGFTRAIEALGARKMQRGGGS